MTAALRPAPVPADAPPYPPCACGGGTVEVTPRDDGRVHLWHAGDGHCVGILGTDDEARRMWRATCEERTR